MSRAVRANLAGVVSLMMSALGVVACNTGSPASQVAPSAASQVAPSANGQQQGSASSEVPTLVAGATPALPTSASAAVVGFQQWADVLCACQGQPCATARQAEYAHWSNPAFRIIDAASTPVSAAESASLKAALERIAGCSPQPAPL